MKNFFGNSSMPPYVKIAATGILSCTYLAALLVATKDYLAGPSAQIPQVVSFILGTGLGVALNVIGIHQGAQLSTEGSTLHASPPTP